MGSGLDDTEFSFQCPSLLVCQHPQGLFLSSIKNDKKYKYKTRIIRLLPRQKEIKRFIVHLSIEGRLTGGYKNKAPPPAVEDADIQSGSSSGEGELANIQ